MLYYIYRIFSPLDKTKPMYKIFLETFLHIIIMSLFNEVIS